MSSLPHFRLTAIPFDGSAAYADAQDREPHDAGVPPAPF
jgi:hypothetical protein